jgi:ABC-type nitrate/sulfonate/bicarbonate transport system ATPase subunit
MTLLRVDLSGFAIPDPARPGAMRPLLGSISFDLAAGEVVALFGPSGCGKTTLLKLIDGLIVGPGISWPGGKPRTAWVFQEPSLLPWRTVTQNIALAQPTGSDPAVIPGLLDSLGLAGWGESFPNRLSLGMARRVAVARALAAKPELLLLDEPLASLDAAAAEALRRVLLKCGLPMLLISHDPADVAALAHRVIVLGGNPTQVRETIVVDPADRNRALQQLAEATVAASRMDQGAAPP